LQIARSDGLPAEASAQAGLVLPSDRCISVLFIHQIAQKQRSDGGQVPVFIIYANQIRIREGKMMNNGAFLITFNSESKYYLWMKTF
jgi:hypothetical protein